MVRDSTLKCLERKERRDTGLKVLTSVGVECWFLEEGILKSEWTQPEVRDELMREVGGR